MEAYGSNTTRQSYAAPRIPKPLELDICQVGAAPFNLLTRKRGTQVFAISMRDIEKALAPKKYINVADKLPKEYHDFLDVFSRKDADILLEYRPYNCTISL